jgi:hypothetical protein
MRVLFAIVIVLVGIETLSAQSPPRKLLGKVIITERGKSMPLANASVRFQGKGFATTDSEGVFDFPLVDGATTLVVDPIKDLDILYPQNGVILIPMDLSNEISIYVGRNDEKKLTDSLLSMLQETIRQKGDLEEIKKEFKNFNSRFQLQEQQLHLKQILVEEEQRLIKEKAKVEVIPRFAATFELYLSRTIDLWKDLDRKKYKVLDDPGQNIQAIRDRLMAYSAAYEALNNDRAAITVHVENDWDNKLLAADVQGLYDYTIDELHVKTVLPFNRLLEDINDYNTRARGHARKSELTRRVESYVDALQVTYEITQKKEVAVLQKLKDY